MVKRYERMTLYEDPPENLGPSRPSLLSRSLKVIGTESDRSGNSDFPLTFCSDLGAYIVPFPKRSEIFADNCEFSPHNPA